MINIKETVKTPSAALQYMVDGLRNQSKRKDFKINMGTFGGNDIKGICFGCAATCTIQEIAGKNLHWLNVNHRKNRADALGFEVGELINFEYCLDSAREGVLGPLFSFFRSGLKGELTYAGQRLYLSNLRKDYYFHLFTSNWEEQLPIVESLIKRLKEDGF